ncbi:hypothetical protein Tco_1104482 [Tanacetum coccineum]
MAYPCLHSLKTTADEDQYTVSRENQYAVFKIWNQYNILENIKRGPYSKKSPIRCDLDNSTSNVLIPLDSWTSGLLVYKLSLSEDTVDVVFDKKKHNEGTSEQQEQNPAEEAGTPPPTPTKKEAGNEKEDVTKEPKGKTTKRALFAATSADPKKQKND